MFSTELFVPLRLQTPLFAGTLYDTGNPEVAVACNWTDCVVKYNGPGFGKLMVWF